MNSISVPIGTARSELCKLVKKVQSGVSVTLTSHGRPQARIVPLAKSNQPWRAETPSDPKLFGDLQSPVLDDWK
jgi:prevent-host-death family protein